MYLMFEALGNVSDRDLMLVNLDLLDTFDTKIFPANQLNFILYNPTPEGRAAAISIPPAQGRKIRLSQDGKTLSETVQVRGHGIIRLLAEY
jgi:hypothetical protein